MASDAPEKEGMAVTFVAKDEAETTPTEAGNNVTIKPVKDLRRKRLSEQLAKLDVNVHDAKTVDGLNALKQVAVNALVRI